MPSANGGLCRRISRALSPMVSLYTAAGIDPYVLKAEECCFCTALLDFRVAFESCEVRPGSLNVLEGDFFAFPYVRKDDIRWNDKFIHE